MKFIKALDGRYINPACVHTLYINSISKNENWVVGIPRDDEETQDYLFGSFKDYNSAKKFLDNLVDELNHDGQVKSNQPLEDKIADARIFLDSAYVDAHTLENDALRNETLYYLDNAINAIDELLNFIK